MVNIYIYKTDRDYGNIAIESMNGYLLCLVLSIDTVKVSSSEMVSFPYDVKWIEKIYVSYVIRLHQ